MGNIKVSTPPQAEYKGRIIVKVGNWYKVQGTSQRARTLTALTDSIK